MHSALAGEGDPSRIGRRGEARRGEWSVKEGPKTQSPATKAPSELGRAKQATTEMTEPKAVRLYRTTAEDRFEIIDT